MPTAKEKAKQRIPFGKNGLKDGNGKVRRTDHMNMKDVLRNIIDGSGVTRQDILNKRIERAVDGDISALKARQDKIAKITRRA